MMPQEIEIKLNLLTNENYRRLIEHLKPEKNPSRQDNYFFDTVDYALAEGGWALRIRIEKNRATITLKGIDPHNIDGLTIRPEIEERLPVQAALKYVKAGLPTGELPPDISRNVRPIAGLKLLRQIAVFTNYRSRAPFSNGNLGFLFEIDKTSFTDGTSDYELEIELKYKDLYKETIKAVSELLEGIEIPVVFQKDSKFARALGRVKDFGSNADKNISRDINSR